MFADLKADSEKWEVEKRELEARGYSDVSYLYSDIHLIRQHGRSSDKHFDPPPPYLEPPPYSSTAPSEDSEDRPLDPYSSMPLSPNAPHMRDP
ncbi:MAG: hypothetical protein M1813_006342 [Trichoglossum hirsutum]|nr:MAG: hypothetical protein M1813_006342 [Trichoglossum hirsutum]